MSKLKKSIQNPAIYFLLSIMAGAGVFILFLALSALILLKINISVEYLPVINYIVSALSVFVSAFIGSNLSRNKRLLKGILITSLLIIVLLFFFFAINQYKITTELILIVPVCYIFSLIGCIAGINFKKK